MHVFPAPAAVQLAASIQKELAFKRPSQQVVRQELCKNPDSFVYSCEEDFAEGFKMSVAFSPREIKVMGTVREGWLGRRKHLYISTALHADLYCSRYALTIHNDNIIMIYASI